jgi:NADH dehydrogenase FAD-containing subunit
MRPYHYTNSAEIVSLGGFSAVLRLFGLRLYGLPARVCWYLAYGTLMVGLPSRIKLGVDWIVSWFFGRDTTLIKVPQFPPIDEP